MKFLVLVAIIVFIAAQITRLRPSARDSQLQALRLAAGHAGLLVKFWSARNSGYTHRELPESGFMYILPWVIGYSSFSRWGIWVSSEGHTRVLAGKPPQVAMEWLSAFQHQFPLGWALLESGEAGLSVLWQERGTEKDVKDLAAAMNLLKDSL